MSEPLLQRREVATAFLRYQGKILVVRRSTRVGSYAGRWSAISGYLEQTSPLAQAQQEIAEETGLQANEIRLISRGEPLEVPAPELGCCWVVHPFLFEIEDPQSVRLDWENLELRWVAPAELSDYDTVPSLREAYLACSGE